MKKIGVLLILFVFLVGCQTVEERGVEIIEEENENLEESPEGYSDEKIAESLDEVAPKKAFGHQFWTEPIKRGELIPGKIKITWLGHGTILFESVLVKK